jgi:hypothetical protein
MARLCDLIEQSMATTSSPTIGLGLVLNTIVLGFPSSFHRQFCSYFLYLLAIRVALLKPTKVIAGGKDKKING